MIVCHCKRVTDRDVRAHVAAGARTERDIARACGAGAGCGGCRETIREVLHDCAPAQKLVFLHMDEVG